jgi:Flp pilus assembly pilin Flp
MRGQRKAALRQLEPRLMGNARGATAIEYAFVAALVAVAIAATLATFGGSLGALFGRAAASFPA